MVLYQIVGYLSVLVLFLVTVLYASKFRELTPWLRYFLIYLMVLLINDILSKYLWLNRINNLAVLHIYNYAEWLILSLYYLQFHSGKQRKWVRMFSVIALLVLLYGTVFLYDLDQFNVIGFFALKLFILLLSLYEIYRYLMEESGKAYYLHIGMALTACVTLCIFSFGNLLLQVSTETQTWLWIFNAVIFILSLGFYTWEWLTQFKWNQKQ